MAWLWSPGRIYKIDANALPKKLPANYLWATIEALSTLPFSGPHRRWIDEIVA